MSDLKRILDGFKKVTKWTTHSDITLGMLRFIYPPDKTECFLFEFSEEEENRIFHTMGMNFNIDILFFDSFKNLVYAQKNVKPNRHIICKWPSKYVLEYSAK